MECLTQIELLRFNRDFSRSDVFCVLLVILLKKCKVFLRKNSNTSCSRCSLYWSTYLGLDLSQEDCPVLLDVCSLRRVVALCGAAAGQLCGPFSVGQTQGGFCWIVHLYLAPSSIHMAALMHLGLRHFTRLSAHRSSVRVSRPSSATPVRQFFLSLDSRSCVCHIFHHSTRFAFSTSSHKHHAWGPLRRFSSLSAPQTPPSSTALSSEDIAVTESCAKVRATIRPCRSR